MSAYLYVPAYLPQAVAPSATYPLDLVASATAGWSTRKLASAYGGSCLRVRRSSDDTEHDIGFSGALLDTGSLLSFCGAGGGLVTTWYDQSGNGRDLSQALTASQPALVSSGAVITTLGGQPCLQWDGSNDYMLSAAAIGTFMTATAATIASVFRVSATVETSDPYAADQVWTINATGNAGCSFVTTGKVVSYNYGSGSAPQKPYSTNTNYLHLFRLGSGTLETYLNSTSPASASASATGLTAQPLRVAQNYDGSHKLTGWIAELLCYDTALSSGDVGTLGAAMAAPYGISWS